MITTAYCGCVLSADTPPGIAPHILANAKKKLALAPYFSSFLQREDGPHHQTSGKRFFPSPSATCAGKKCFGPPGYSQKVFVHGVR